jgi:hypothetical protein
MLARWRSAYEAFHGVEPPWTFGTALADANNRRSGAPLFHGTLDYIFVPPQLRVTDALLFGDKPSPDAPDVCASDHIGILAKLEVLAAQHKGMEPDRVRRSAETSPAEHTASDRG